MKLSRNRAAAVAAYLVRVHGFDTRRLSVEGVGFDQLRDPEYPESEVNRRVQVTNISP